MADRHQHSDGFIAEAAAKSAPSYSDFLVEVRNTGADALSAAALRGRRQELPDGGFWLHWRTTPQRDDGGGDVETADEGRVPCEGAASGYAAVMGGS